MIEKIEKSELLLRGASQGGEQEKRFMMQQYEQQVEMLKQQIKMKEDEADQLREQFDQMDKQINHVSDIANKYKESQQQNGLLMKQIEDVNAINK